MVHTLLTLKSPLRASMPTLSSDRVPSVKVVLLGEGELLSTPFQSYPGPRATLRLEDARACNRWLGIQANAACTRSGAMAHSRTLEAFYGLEKCCCCSGRVGKTSLLLRWANDSFDLAQSPTLQASFLTKTLTIDGAQAEVNVWDTAGQVR